MAILSPMDHGLLLFVIFSTCVGHALEANRAILIPLGNLRNETFNVSLAPQLALATKSNSLSGSNSQQDALSNGIGSQLNWLFPPFEGARVTSAQPELLECCTHGARDAGASGKCDQRSSTLSSSSERLDADSIRSASIDACHVLWRYCCLVSLGSSECDKGARFALNLYKAKKSIDCGRPSTRITSSIVIMDNQPNQAFQCCSACESGLAFGRFLAEKHMPDQYCSMDEVVPSNICESKVSEVMRPPFKDCCRRSHEESQQRNKKQAPTAAEGLLGLGLPPTASEQEIHATIQRKMIHLIENSSLKKRLCEHGFEYNVTAGQCLDVDECLVHGHTICKPPSTHCVNTQGGFYCALCARGYRHRSQVAPAQLADLEASQDCVDIDECRESTSLCQQNQVCHNNAGGFDCLCKPGYELDSTTGKCVDINECQLDVHDCGVLRCDNTIGSYHCVRVMDCGTGYTIRGDACEDIDECSLAQHNCPPDYKCRNTQGSFKCDRLNCPAGSVLASDGICHRTICPAGFVFNTTEHVCQPEDLCASNPCAHNERCAVYTTVHRDVMFACFKFCSPGFRLLKASNTCVDIDECGEGLAKCGHRQECLNAQGSYDCRCAPGFRMYPDRTCHDIDECHESSVTSLSHLCPSEYRCVNTIGSYVCQDCRDGYHQLESGHCVDIDECAPDGPGQYCQHECYNMQGSFQCRCRSGYVLADDDRTCVDIDECEVYGYNLRPPQTRASHCIGVCINTVGSFQCRCPEGFRQQNDRCVDINECHEQRNLCAANDDDKTITCINLLGSHECSNITCPQGYSNQSQGNSIVCTSLEPALDPREANRISHLFFGLFNNQMQGYLEKGYLFYSTSYPMNEQSRGPFFHLQLISATKAIRVEDFRIHRQNATTTIWILRPLPGPAKIHLRLLVEGYKNDQLWRETVNFYLNISKYDFYTDV